MIDTDFSMSAISEKQKEARVDDFDWFFLEQLVDASEIREMEATGASVDEVWQSCFKLSPVSTEHMQRLVAEGQVKFP